MGMYTEFIFGCELSKETPKICIEAMDHVINFNKKEKYKDPQSYEEKKYNESFIETTLSIEEIEGFIEKYDFYRLFRSSSYYFGGANPICKFYWDPISKSYHVSTRADLKNGGKIEKFIEYIRPYVTQGSGYSHNIFAYVQYEEDEFPTIYGIDGEYHVDDPAITKMMEERNEKRWNLIDKLVTLIPEFKVNEELLKKYNIQPDNYCMEDGVTMMVDYLIEKFKK